MRLVRGGIGSRRRHRTVRERSDPAEGSGIRVGAIDQSDARERRLLLAPSPETGEVGSAGPEQEPRLGSVVDTAEVLSRDHRIRSLAGEDTAAVERRLERFHVFQRGDDVVDFREHLPVLRVVAGVDGVVEPGRPLALDSLRGLAGTAVRRQDAGAEPGDHHRSAARC